jgi:tetratricopeptide (TPR) repeat protein
VALYEFWNVRHVSEARRRFEEILFCADVMSLTPLCAKALLTAGRVSDSYTVQRTRFEESLAISRALDDKRGIADALHFLGDVTARQGDRDRVLALYEESQAIYRELGDKAGIASILMGQAHLAFLQGEYERWAALNNESVVIKRELGDKEGLGACLINLGEWARKRGDYERAEAYYEESLSVYQELGDKGGAAVDLINIGFVALHRGDYERAAARFGESLVLSRESKEKDLIGTCLGGLAAVAAAHGRSKRAARLAGAMNAIFASIGEQITSHIARAELDAIDRAEYERAIAPARTQLGEAVWAAAYAEGRAMSLEQGITYALSVNTVP